MKRKHYIILTVFLLAVSLVYFIPVILAKSRAVPMYGMFDLGGGCMCGHHLFIVLEDDAAYQYTPGHNDREYMGRVERDGDTLKIYLDWSVDKYWQVQYDGREHTVVTRENGEAYPFPQVNNPWREWVPLWFSE